MLIRRWKVSAVLFAAAALGVACSAERAREETSGAVATSAVVAAGPAAAVGLPYFIFAEHAARRERENLTARLDPLYLDHLKRIRMRDPRRDAEESFAASGAVFLVYSSSIDARPATLEAHGIVMPAGSVEARRATDIVEDVPIRELQELIAPDPAHDPGADYFSDTYVEFYRQRRDYVGAFNDRVLELATEASSRSRDSKSRPGDASRAATEVSSRPAESPRRKD